MRELKFLLNRWAVMQRDIEEPFNRKSMEKLYKALNTLPDDERLFLAKKYFNKSGKPFSDDVMAEKEGFKPSDYTRKRAKIESRLSNALRLVLDAERKPLRDQVDLSGHYESMNWFRRHLEIDTKLHENGQIGGNN